MAERGCDGVRVFDVRVTGREVGWLGGRKAEGNQRMGVHIWKGESGGEEVWAGGGDGRVRMWRWDGRVDVGSGTEEHEVKVKSSEWEWDVTNDGSAVGGVGVHPSGLMVVTASGERKAINVDDDTQEETSAEGRPMDNTVKIWLL